jgi:hypothetical protein
MNIIDFWKPRFKRQLVEVLSERYPNDKNRFKKMSKKRLYAIYYNYRKNNI